MNDNTFNTVAMAEILLVQDLVGEAARVIAQLEIQFPGDTRVAALRTRMRRRMDSCAPEQQQRPASGRDFLDLTANQDVLHLQWELTENGLAIAKRRVRYSGFSIIRLFTAAGGPRGVRTTSRDMELVCHCGEQQLVGMPQQAYHAGAIGYLGRNGAFVPLATAQPVKG